MTTGVRISSLPQRGWFMSDDAQRQIKATALLEYTEVKSEVAMLRQKIADFGTFFEGVAKLLKTDPAMYLWKGFTFPDKKEIDESARSLAAAEERMSQLKTKLMDFGVPV